MKHYAILLATDDSAVEATMHTLAGGAEFEINRVRTNREAVSMIMDGSLNQDLAIVDLDLRDGGRSLLQTAGGSLPVIAIATKAKPWLSSMLRHRRIRATLTKPVSRERLSDALQRVRAGSFLEARSES